MKAAVSQSPRASTLARKRKERTHTHTHKLLSTEVVGPVSQEACLACAGLLGLVPVCANYSFYYMFGPPKAFVLRRKEDSSLREAISSAIAERRKDEQPFRVSMRLRDLFA